MDLILNLIIGLAALVAAAYCLLLSRRLRALSRLDSDVGAAIAILSRQVDALTSALQAAQTTSTRAEDTLRQTISRADDTIRKLELLLAAGGRPDPSQTAASPMGQPQVQRSRRARYEVELGGPE